MVTASASAETIPSCILSWRQRKLAAAGLPLVLGAVPAVNGHGVPHRGVSLIWIVRRQRLQPHRCLRRTALRSRGDRSRGDDTAAARLAGGKRSPARRMSYGPRVERTTSSHLPGRRLAGTSRPTSPQYSASGSPPCAWTRAWRDCDPGLADSAWSRGDSPPACVSD